MKIVVLGLWHLGCVTAASCAPHFPVVGLDFDRDNVAALRLGKLPVFEPGLEDLLQQGVETHGLTFTTDVSLACESADVLWVTYDTPVDDEDRPDAEAVLTRVRTAVPYLPANALVLLSSQLPVGSCRKLEAEFPGRRFACSPENLRLGHALKVFNAPERIVAGCRTPQDRAQLAGLFAPFCADIVWMTPESAEMTKHALNSFLAVSITFANEIARLCELTGADAKQVEQGLKSDVRIGPGAYLSPGGAFAGGTLARDVVTLTQLAAARGARLAVIPAIKESNDRQKDWALNRMKDHFGDLRGKIIGILGLTYKPRTDTLRRSQALELCRKLARENCQVRAYDPTVRELPDLEIAPSAAAVIQGADAVVICTEWPEFKDLPWPELLGEMRQACIFDANRFVQQPVGLAANARYFSVGKPA